MRLAHPPPKLVPPLNFWLIPRLLHPLLKVLGAHPAWIQLGEQGEEGRGLGLERGRCGLGVGCGEGVQQGPRAAAQLLDVGGTVAGDGGCQGGG